ncbi:TonB-dependent receptor [Sinobacterium caligoides]|uniref:TonB-dependent receptor n=1 Tax=Sinobacterium caligoides TaxID=933926 RepID=A0A3N2D596_9GAMM|nr:TonB-dependent receptor [Sinobacterium caligoides]ROR94923.1 TonB-dependent receptor [Sinobacterium caligoides]
MNNKRVKTQFRKNLLALAIAAASTAAMADGRLEGKVSLEQAGVSLEGASVTIPSLNLKTNTRRDGSYTLSSVPAGEYELVVDYLGAELTKTTVVVQDDETQSQNFVLSKRSDEEVLVIGQSASANKSLNKQRAADNIKSIVSADAIGNFPDANASEALSRMPGISIERDQGEGRFVRVRGLAPKLNAVTINGTKMPAPGGSQRSVGMDTIPSDLIESLEVTKSLTPDMDADAIGGSIEVKSLSAFDREGFYYSASAEASYDDHTGDTSPKLSAVASNVFELGDADRKLGVAAAISWYDRDFGSNNVETGGAWDFEQSPAGLEGFEQRHYTINRQRTGLGVNFDYQHGVDHEYYLRTLMSEFQDTETRQASVIEFIDGEGDGEARAAGVRGQAEVARELKDRIEQQTVRSVVIGGINRVDSWTYDYAAGFSVATEKKDQHIAGAAFEAEFDDMGWMDSEKPYLLAPAGYYDAASYALDDVETESVDAQDREHNIRLDISRDFFIGDLASQFKFGGKLSRREKVSDDEVIDYGDFSDQLLPMSSYVSGEVDYRLASYGPGIDGGKLSSVLAQAGEVERNLEDSQVNDYTIHEDINAAYAMMTVDIDRWRILGGMRYEATDITADGLSFNEEADEATTATQFSNDYDHWLPALHVRYSLSEQSILRAAWTNSVVRPTFEEMSPGEYIDGNEVERGNPNLDPWESSNIDVGIEHYFATASTLQAFLFYKDISHFIYESEHTLSDANETEIHSFSNGDSAEVYGLELVYQQQFSQLPAPWDGLLVEANATFTDSEADLGDRKVTLPSQSDVIGNLSIGYENDWMSLRLSANYKSEYLLETGSSQQEDAYVDEQMQVDATARFWITEGIQLYLQGINLTNQPYYVYNNHANYNNQYEEYGPTFKLGVQLTDF